MSRRKSKKHTRSISSKRKGKGKRAGKKGTGVITPRSEGQKRYLRSIHQNKLTLCTGPAGTGKTMIAIGAALHYYREGIHKRIKIVRPAIVACNEYLGFLPGSIEDKMNPFIIPILYNMKKLTSPAEYQHMVKYVVEVIPMGYMRGLTEDDCFIILDEAQNTQIKQMKMFLTRIGKNCKVVVEGDEDQSDIRAQNGLSDAIDRLDDMDNVGIVEMDRYDILRSPFVAAILERYEDT